MHLGRIQGAIGVGFGGLGRPIWDGFGGGHSGDLSDLTPQEALQDSPSSELTPQKRDAKKLSVE